MSISAWREPDGSWTWNEAIYVWRNVEIPDEIFNNNQKLIEYCVHDLGIFDTDALDGRIVVEEVGDTMLEFQDADNDFEPLVAFEVI
jgi:hypothetical protein